MARLEEIVPNAIVSGVITKGLVTVVNVEWYGDSTIEITYKDSQGNVGNQLKYRDDEASMEINNRGRPWIFDGDGDLFTLVSEARRISLAHLFDKRLAVNTSLIEPLPHQITAVYEFLLTRQPLRFLLADDPGAGKTIMAGLFIKELIARGDLQRCLIVCPGGLVEQWQDELYQKFRLPFEIATTDKLEASYTGNWFTEKNLVIARLDKLSRDEEVQKKLRARDCQWDVVIFDEAHKLSASYFGREVHYTKRYHLGTLLSGQTRHLLLMTATPHNGKEEDFQLFMALLDEDRFEGKFRDGVHRQDASDLMRRMVKEDLLRFDGTRLFPERHARAISFRLSDMEANLYSQVTEYVREEFNRADALANDRQKGNVGFALTILQRRLASSPEAIYQSLRRRTERLDRRLEELQLIKRDELVTAHYEGDEFDDEDFEDLEDAPEDEIADVEEKVLDQATAARTIDELRVEISMLDRLTKFAGTVRSSGEDRKWNELSELIQVIFSNKVDNTAESAYGLPPTDSKNISVSQEHQKLVIFTEHKDTLNYLFKRITTLIGNEQAVVTIHGSKRREDRLKVQSAFRNDPDVKILVATDAAGEGINLQRAHLMVNYDMPWNPNRIEQRFGRIHRIGQTKECHLWNMIAVETREGDVYLRLIEKLEEARSALGGKVFDVLGQLEFGGKSLKDLLIESIRHGDDPAVQARLEEVIENAVDQEHLKKIFKERSLVPETMDSSVLQLIREDMDRAEARRLQPFYVKSFFIDAFILLGGKIKEREKDRYEITHVPAPIRNRDRVIGIREPVLRKYERITFDKDFIASTGHPQAEFVCPGHPLLDSVLDLTLERNRDLLRRGTVLVDEQDLGTAPRVLFYLDHSVKDAVQIQEGMYRTISRKMLYVEIDADGYSRQISYAPYLDYRSLKDDEPSIGEILNFPELSWIKVDLEKQVVGHAVATLVPSHRDEIRSMRLDLIRKTRDQVKDRLTKEINYWDHRAEELKAQESTGKVNAKVNSQEARRRADEMQERLVNRLDHLSLEEQITTTPPVVMGGVVVIPKGLLLNIAGKRTKFHEKEYVDKMAVAARARDIVMDIERGLGHKPEDKEFEKLGWDIESSVPGGNLRLIEVKGRSEDGDTVTFTKNEILHALNMPDDYIVAIVIFMRDNSHKITYVRNAFQKELDFHVKSVTYDVQELISIGETPS